MKQMKRIFVGTKFKWVRRGDERLYKDTRRHQEGDPNIYTPDG